MNMGVSQLLYMYVISLIIMAFNIIIVGKIKHAKINNMEACKLNKELEIVTKIIRANL